MDQNRDAVAQELYEEDTFEAWEDDLDDEEAWESFPPELLARSMTDALERLKNFDPFAI